MKALDVAADFSKQQIAFAGILVSVNLAFFPEHFDKLYPWASELTKWAWLLLVLSIGSGLVFLGRMSYLVQKPIGPATIFDWGLRLIDILQFSLLVPGVAALIYVMFCGYTHSDCSGWSSIASVLQSVLQ